MNPLWIDNFHHDRQTCTITANLTCSAKNGYLSHHFTGFPVVPGVVLLEGFRQAFQLSNYYQQEHGNIYCYEQFRFQEFVRPGQTVQLLLTIDENNGAVQCRGLVNEKPVTRGRMLFRPDIASQQQGYVNGNCHSFEHWRWYHDWQQLEDDLQVLTRLSPPLAPEVDCQGTIPEPLIFEGLAQTGVQLLQKHFPRAAVVALAKIPTLIIKNSIDYHQSVQLHVAAEQLDRQGGRFQGTAYAGQQELIQTEFLLAYCEQAEAEATSHFSQQSVRGVAS